jgi:hypothetical protein
MNHYQEEPLIQFTDSDSDSDSDLNSDEYWDSDEDAYYQPNLYGLGNVSDSPTDSNVSSDTIYRYDQSFLDSEKVDGTYYLGTVYLPLYEQSYLLSIAIQTKTFFKFSYPSVVRYMCRYSIFMNSPKKIDIIQLRVLEDGSYICIIKTHWIRIIQRHWKKTYRQQTDTLNRRKHVDSLFEIQTKGRYPIGARYNPTIRGMLAQYPCPRFIC